MAYQERRFRRPCEQIVQLNFKLDYLESRYKKAKRNKREALLRSYVIKLAVINELRELYFIFATKKAEIIHDMTEVVQRLRDGEESYLIQKALLRAIQLFQKESRVAVHLFKMLKRENHLN